MWKNLQEMFVLQSLQSTHEVYWNCTTAFCMCIKARANLQMISWKKKEYWKNTQQTKCLYTVHWNPSSPHSSTDINMQRRVDMHIKFPF